MVISTELILNWNDADIVKGMMKNLQYWAFKYIYDVYNKVFNPKVKAFSNLIWFQLFESIKLSGMTLCDSFIFPKFRDSAMI